MKKTLLIKNEISELEKLPAFIGEIADALQLDSRLVMNLNIALEEAISNIIMYGYPKGMGDTITIQANCHDYILIFTITDTGEAFDPTQVAEVDTSLSAEERPIGGLGIFLIKNIMNEVEYQRIEATNIFTMKKFLNK